MQALIARAGQPGPQLIDVDPMPVSRDEIRVRVAAAAVNPADNWVAGGTIRDVFPLPETVGLGYDLSGTVTEVGADVDDFSPGDTVAALHADLEAPVRAHAAYTTVPASAAAHVPDGLDLLDAASVPLNALTAAQALDLLGPADGRTLLVTGAAGGVGGYAVALAARAGWRVTGHARETDETFVRDAGAEATVTRMPNAAFDAVLDAAALQANALTAARDGGAFIGVLPPAPVEPERQITVDAVSIAADGQRLAELLQLSRDGVLATRVAGQVALTDAEAAYRKQASGGHRGRWLLTP